MSSIIDAPDGAVCSRCSREIEAMDIGPRGMLAAIQHEGESLCVECASKISELSQLVMLIVFAMNALYDAQFHNENFEEDPCAQQFIDEILRERGMTN